MQTQKRFSAGALLLAFTALILTACSSMPNPVSADGPTLFPAHGADEVSPDTVLRLTFDTAPELGDSGLIEIFDAATGERVDVIDLSIAPSPRPNGRMGQSNEAERRAFARSYSPENYHLNTIGGVDFHYFPVIIRDKTATIHLHNSRLDYGRDYRVTISADAFSAPGFSGVSADAAWRFSTRAAGPAVNATRIVVDADGGGDFVTVQGAIDFAPADLGAPMEIFIRDGHYEELVFMKDKQNLTLRGQSRDGVVVSYPNNSAFNPPRKGPSRRPAFSVFNSDDIQLSTFTIRNDFIGQAEALLVRGERVVIDNMSLDGSGDAMTTRGSIYMVDSSLKGDGDTILAYASLFCLRCEISSVSPFTWTRTPEGRHGNVFVDSHFINRKEPLPWSITEKNPNGQVIPARLARLPRNGPGTSAPNFPHAEMVLINAVTDGVPPEGWGPVQPEEDGFDWTNVRFWEFNTRDETGALVDMSKRHPIVRVLKQPEDAQVIKDYSTPEYVLGGWSPVVRAPEGGAD